MKKFKSMKFITIFLNKCVKSTTHLIRIIPSCDINHMTQFKLNYVWMTKKNIYTFQLYCITKNINLGCFKYQKYFIYWISK